MEDSKFKNSKKIKLILLGKSKVGKTCLINKYINNNLPPEYYLTTVGTDKSQKFVKIKNKEINLQIWDTSGQEEYRSVNKIYMKNTQIALIVYDITEYNSFEQLNYLIDTVKEINKEKEIIIGIAANKNNLFDKQVIKTDEGKKFANDNNCLYFETSSTDYESIEYAFHKIS